MVRFSLIGNTLKQEYNYGRIQQKSDANAPKQEFSGSAAKGKMLPDMYDTSKPKKEFGNKKKELPLRGGVIEVKGPSMELPRTLRRMKLLNTDWSRFSKYSHCIDAHLAEPGTIARLWPSGRMVQS